MELDITNLFVNNFKNLLIHTHTLFAYIRGNIIFIKFPRLSFYINKITRRQIEKSKREMNWTKFKFDQFYPLQWKEGRILVTRVI